LAIDDCGLAIALMIENWRWDRRLWIGDGENIADWQLREHLPIGESTEQHRYNRRRIIAGNR
jgi:hypothetical protein